MTINDKENSKFILSNWVVKVKLSQVSFWSEISTLETNPDLENQKFDSNWNIRVIVSM